MGCAKYVGRVGALAVALGIGAAVVTAPGIAWADETSAASDDGSPHSGSEPAGPSTDDTGTPGAAENGTDGPGGTTTTVVTTQEGSSTTTVGGGPVGPTVTFGNSSNTGSIGGSPVEDTPSPAPTSSSASAPVTGTPSSAVDPTTVVASPTPTPTPTAAPAGAQDHTNVIATNEPAVATGSSTSAPSTSASQNAPRVFQARLANQNAGDVNAPASNTLQDNAFSALAAPALPVPTAPQPTLADVVLALPGTIISTALNLITAALAPLIGPGAPADNPVLWGVLAFVRRQFNESFANSTPVLAPRQTSQDVDDNQVHGTFGGTDADGDTLAYVVPSTGTGAPAHGTVTVDQASGTYTYTPTAGYVGEDYFFVTATDATGAPHVHTLGQTHTAVARVDVTVAPGTTPVNHAPVAGNDSFTTDEDTAFSGSVLGNDSDSDGNPLHTVSEAKSTTAGGTVAIHADGTFTYTPTANFNGTDTFTYTVKDGTSTVNDSALGTVTMTVTPVNDAPTLSVVTENTGAANGAVKITISYGDVDDATLTSTTPVPLHGGYASTIDGPLITDFVVGTHTVETSSGATPNVAYYIPNPALPGTDTLTFTLTDASGASVTKTAVIEVAAPSEPVNHAPTLEVSTEPTGASNGAVKVTLTFSDPDDDPATFYIAPLAHGSLYGDATGTVPIPTDVTFPSTPLSSTPVTGILYYIPDPSRPGTETLSFTLTDASGASVTQTADVEVAGPSDSDNHAPTLAVSTEPTGASNGAVKVTLTFAEPDNDVVTSYIAPLEHGGLYADATGLAPIPTGVSSPPFPGSSTSVTQSAYYIPDPSRPGTETLSFTLTDASGASVTKTAVVEVVAEERSALLTSL